MSLAVLANHMASKGRNGDSMLVHMTPDEVRGLHALAEAHGGGLTINPETGLPEANFLKRLLPTIIGAVLTPLTGGLINPMTAGFLVGGVEALRTGDLGKGIAAGLGAYGGANLATAFTSAGTSGLAGSEAALAAGREAAAGRAGLDTISMGVGEGFAQDAVRDAVAKQAAQNYAANLPFTDKLTAGFSGLTEKAGRDAFMKEIGGLSGLARAGYMAAAPGLVGDVPTATSMPSGPGAPSMMRPYKFDYRTRTWTAQPIYPAKDAAATTTAQTPTEEPPLGGAGGGLMSHYAAGGGVIDDFAQSMEPVIRMANGGATREQVLQAYRTNPGAELNPNEEAINYWMKQGLGSFTDVVNQTRAANPALAQQIDAARTAATTQQFATPASTLPNYLGLNAVAAGQPGGQTVISGTAGPGYDYSAAALTDPTQTAINDIYNRVLGRQAEQEGLNYWTNAVKNNALSLAEVEGRIRQIGQDIGVNVDPTQLATPTAVQLGAQRSILADPKSAALGLVRSGVATGLTDQQIADLANQTYGKSFNAQNVADFMRANNITRPAPVTAVSPTFTGTDTGTTVTPAPLPGLPDFAPTTPTLAPATQFTPQTMEEVRTKYEQGGGATRMPTITDIKPGERTYTQNEAFGLLSNFLQTNPNAQYGEVLTFARMRGIPEYQARAAFNEFRFSGLTGDSKAAYNYLMGRGAYPTGSLARPVIRPYAEAMGLTDSAIRRTTPTTPERREALSAGTGAGTTGGGSGASTAGVSAGLPSLTSNSLVGGTSRNTVVTGDNRTYADQATINSGVVVGNNVVDPISGRVIGTITANVDDGTGGIVVGSVIVDPISGRIIGQAEDAGVISRLVDKKVGEELAPIESRTPIPVPDRMPERSEYDVGGPNYTDEELALMAGMRNGGLSALAGGGMSRTRLMGVEGGAARGGHLGDYSDGGRLLRGPGDGVSDSIPATIAGKRPARLADGEFVVPARIVSELGNGSTEAGARKLYAMMDRIQAARRKSVGKGKVAKNTRADKYLPA